MISCLRCRLTSCEVSEALPCHKSTLPIRGPFVSVLTAFAPFIYKFTGGLFTWKCVIGAFADHRALAPLLLQRRRMRGYYGVTQISLFPVPRACVVFRCRMVSAHDFNASLLAAIRGTPAPAVIRCRMHCAPDTPGKAPVWLREIYVPRSDRGNQK